MKTYLWTQSFLFDNDGVFEVSLLLLYLVIFSERMLKKQQSKFNYNRCVITVVQEFLQWGKGCGDLTISLFFEVYINSTTATQKDKSDYGSTNYDERKSFIILFC